MSGLHICSSRTGRRLGRQSEHIDILLDVTSQFGGVPPIDLIWQRPDGTYIIWYKTGEVGTLLPPERIHTPEPYLRESLDYLKEDF